jgi:hypothetical protein
MSQTASLVLKSSDLTFGSSTPVGTADANGVTLTWNNINLRVLLGDIYDMYDRFNLNLNTIATSIAGAIGTSADDRACYITIAGLPWINNTYNQKSNSNSNATVIASCVFISGGQTTQYYYGNNTTTFIKNQDICNITISIRKILDDASPSTANAFPRMMFIFDIEGVEAYKVKDITDARILK